MKRALALIAVLLLFSSTSTSTQAGGFMRTYDYYNDMNFTQWLDFAYTNCSGTCVSGNCTYDGPYRIVEVEDCDTWEVTQHYCQAWNGSNYQTISCP